MSLYIDKKFINILSPRLNLFKQKGEFLWNFRCPICGDSQKNKTKARGYVYRRKSDLFYTCHNCGTSISFGNFLKSTDMTLYREYQMERFKCESAGNIPAPDFSELRTKKIFATSNNSINLPAISDLSSEHFAKKFLLDRKIPNDRFGDLYFANDFGSFVKEMLPDNNKELGNEPRVIIPFYDTDRKLLGFQGRALTPISKTKYITIKLDDDYTKLYGLDTIDTKKKIYVIEGPFDSMFLKNSLAMMDASLYNIRSILNPKYDYTLIYDNEPRNIQICNNMLQSIKLNLPIFIWSKNMEFKDINEAIIGGYTGAEIQSIIDMNTFSGLEAMLRYNNWKR